MSTLPKYLQEARKAHRAKRPAKLRVFRHALPTGGWLVMFGKYPATASILKVCTTRAEADAYIALITPKE